MANGYEVKITQTGGGEIVLGSKALSSVQFIIDTTEENVKDRSENIINKVIVKGYITVESKAVTKDLLLWSLSTKNEEIYRNAEITIHLNETARVRKFTMDKVFCIDYMETFNHGQSNSSSDNNSTFELTFGQRQDNFEGITVLC